MKELHQDLLSMLDWPYPMFSNIMDIYIDMVKERNEAEKEREKSMDKDMHSKVSNMQKQYGLSGLPKIPSFSNFSSLNNIKF